MSVFDPTGGDTAAIDILRSAPLDRRSLVRAIGIGGLVLTGGLLLSGCTPSGNFGEFILDETPPPETSGDAEAEDDRPVEAPAEAPPGQEGLPDGAALEDGGRLYIGLSETISSLDPITAEGSDAAIAKLIVEGLVRETADGLGVEPCLAESWEVDGTGCSYTFHLPTGLVFSDGTSVTADDWQWTFDQALEAVDAPWYPHIDGIDHVFCPDDQTVEVVFTEAGSTHASILCLGALGVQSRARYESASRAYGTRTGGVEAAPIGTGPWAVGSWNADGTVELVANTAFRTKGEPLLDGVVLAAVKDPAQRVLQLQRGTFDVVVDVPDDLGDELESDPDCMVQVDPSVGATWLAPDEYAAAVEGGPAPAEAGPDDRADADETDREGTEGLVEAAAPMVSYLAARKTVSGLTRTPLGSWRLETVEKTSE